MKMKYSYNPERPGELRLAEELRAQPQVGKQLEELTAWTKASEIEKTRWNRLEEILGVRVTGSMHDLVEDLLVDRAFEKTAGVYLAAGAELDDLVYAARRLLQAGQKVVLLDWDVTRGAGEELLSSEIPVIDIHQGGDPLVDLAGGGRAELVVDQGADDLDWTMTVKRAGELIHQLDGVDVIVFLAKDTATEALELEEDTVDMSASTVGRLAGAWGASVLMAGASARTYAVLGAEMFMIDQELRNS